MRQQLTIDISNEESPVGGISIFTEVYVGDKKLEDILDIPVFFKAIETSGLYPLFTCECGCFGCGGYYVEVECTENDWILRNKYDPNTQELMTLFEYEFSWAQVYLIVTKIKDYIREICKKQIGGIVATGTAGAFSVGLVLESNKGISLREVAECSNQDMFSRYLAIVEAEARRLGKVFYFYSEESNRIIWAEKEIELASISGWLLEPDEVDDFNRCYDEYNNEEKEWYEFSEKYYPKLRNAEWSFNKDGVLTISFS